MISARQIKELRDQTGISISQCKQALEAAGGDLTKALQALREQGTAIAAKKSTRALGAGVISAYIHNTGATGTIVELDCETDFVAKNEDFRTLGDDLAMHVTAFQPSAVEELLGQPFVKDPAVTVGDLIKQKIQKFGENIEVVRFHRLVVGER